jgi:predicted lipoprotein with Yx(FWY)xxD motif
VTISPLTHTRYQRLLAVAAVAAVTFTACGDDDDDAAGEATEAAPTDDAAPATDAPATDAPPTTASDRAGYGDSPAATSAPAGGDSAVTVADTELGEIVADAAGMSLYIFLPDNAGDPTCAADCAQAWPPFTVADGAAASAGDGIDAAMLGTATHPEAGTQVTFNGWPLYYFAGDTAPGDTTGNGQGDVWYVLDAAGNPIDG